MKQSTLVFLLAALVAGCATTPPEVGGVDAFVAAQVERAGRLEDEGRIAEAIRVWQIVLSADASHAEARSSATRLIELRDEQVGNLLARAARMKTDRSKRETYLKVLALDGDNKQAHDQLRDMHVRKTLANQQAKDAERNERLAAEPPAPDPAPAPATTSSLDPALSDRLTAEGEELIRTDLDAAIDRWERALIANPENQRARAQLTRAQRMRENLRRIQGH